MSYTGKKRRIRTLLKQFQGGGGILKSFKFYEPQNRVFKPTAFQVHTP